MAALVSASPVLLDSLQKSVAECDPVLAQGDLSTALFEKVRGVPGANRDNVRSIVRTLFSLYAALRGDGNMSATEAATETVRAIRSEDRYPEPQGGWDTFQGRLERFLTDDGSALALSAKALSIALQTERHAQTIKVLTDARPIFGKNAKDGPQAFSIIHSLRIEYFQDGEEHEWYVSLDSDDLQSLQGAAERALAKERSLKTMLDGLKIPVLCWKASDTNGK